MFGKLKDLAEMKKQASQMQAMLAGEHIQVEKNGIKIVMDGNMQILEVKTNAQLDQEAQEKYLKESFNQAIQKVQRLMAEKMMGRI
jgi:DNA-binding protein YbaB